MLGEEVLVQEGQFHGVHDLVDLAVEPAHVGVGDVGDLLEHQLLDLGSGQLLEQQGRSGIEQDGIAGPQLHVGQVGGQLHDLLLVGATEDHGSTSVGQELLEGDDLASALGGPRQHHVERFVEHHLGTPGELLVAELGMQRHTHLAPAGEHVDGAVVVVTEERAVGRGGLGELLDLLAQRRDVLARLAQGVRELLVLADRLGELALGLEESLFQGPDALGCVLEAAT